MKQFNFRINNDYSNYHSPIVVNEDGMRQYKEGNDLFPSITSIRSREPNPGIEKWRQRVGDNVADHICRNAVGRGNVFHKICESYLSNSCVCQFSDNLLEYSMFEQVRSYLDRIDDIVGIEMPMISKWIRIGGTADIIAKFDGEISVIDLKSSTSPKKDIWCKRFFLQECAYSMMYEEITGVVIENLVTLIASEDGVVQVIKNNRNPFTDDLHKIVEGFHENYLSKTGFNL